MSIAILNSLTVIDSDELDEFDDIDSSTTAILEALSAEVQAELQLLLHRAELAEDTLIADPDADADSEVKSLHMLAVHIWLRIYYTKISSSVDEEGFNAKVKLHTQQVERQQLLALGLDKNLKPVGEHAVKTLAGPSTKGAQNELRHIGVG